jgi:hypothetical protein
MSGRCSILEFDQIEYMSFSVVAGQDIFASSTSIDLEDKCKQTCVTLLPYTWMSIMFRSCIADKRTEGSR